MTSGLPRSPLPRRARRALWAAVLLFLLFLGWWVAIILLLDPGAALSELKPRMEAALGRPVTVRNVSVGILPPAVRLQEVALPDSTGGPSVLAHAESVALRAALLPLSRGELRVTALDIRKLTVDLGTMSPGLGGLELFLERMLLGSPKRGRPLGQGTTLGVGHGEVRVGPSTSPWTAPVHLAADLEVEAQEDRVRLRAGRLDLGLLALNLVGQLDGLQHPVRALVLEAWGEGMQLGDLLDAFLPSRSGARRIEGEGILSASVRATGEVGPGRAPDIRGDLRLAGGSIHRGEVVLAEAIDADLSVAPGVVVGGAARGVLLGGPFEMTGSLDLGGGGPELEVFLQAAHRLEMVTRSGALGGRVTAAGQLGGNLRIQGPLGDLARLLVDGELHPMGVTLSSRTWRAPIEVAEGTLRVEGSRVLVDSLPILLGGDRAIVTGEIPTPLSLLFSDSIPRFRGSVRLPGG